MAGFDLASAYAAQQQGGGGAPPPDDAQQSGGGDLTVPGDVAQQIAQAIQANDCQTVCKLMGAIISQGQ